MSDLKFIFKPGRLNVGYKLEDSKGFTLIEVLVAIAIFAIISVGMVTIFDSLQRGNTEQQVITDVIQKNRGALSFMTEEIKLAGLDPTESGNFTVRTATATDFTYDYDSPDVDNKFDGILTIDDADNPERRTFSLDGGSLYQSENSDTPAVADYPAKDDADGGWEELVSGIDMANSRFEYLNENGTVLNPIVINDIRAVRVVLTVREPSGRSGEVSRTLTAMALCRNLHFNSQR